MKERPTRLGVQAEDAQRAVTSSDTRYRPCDTLTPAQERLRARKRSHLLERSLAAALLPFGAVAQQAHAGGALPTDRCRGHASSVATTDRARSR